MNSLSLAAGGTPVLRGDVVHLEPLCQDHAQGLFLRGRHVPDWAYMPRSCFVDIADTRQWIDEALAATDQQAWVIVENAKGKIVGSSRYLNISAEHRSLEIGWTWLGQEWQRTGVNTEAKLLLLQHAFERRHCLRVEFKVDARNLRSQRALERIGAVREGVLRKHRIVQNDFARDSVFFSVVDTEWPDVKRRLTVLREGR
ncbi:GNAT family N-acetyltransferase [Kineobactrum sediminis]|uniref:GNAT family N-acetyltransferase n=1 Tax=Kineobactrum sediminis TaxID=1905677 RepID=A0A2N5Y0J7_9GAMM|nr:GNAT family protein [Kineobactrum sediminis]PLW81924.1 GNAT family N-acetyltransferase [Kineobactrum sediminis]